MPDMPNYKELGQPIVTGDVDATEVYDQRYGKYTDQQGKNVTPGAKPHDPSPPFSLGGGGTAE